MCSGDSRGMYLNGAAGRATIRANIVQNFQLAIQAGQTIAIPWILCRIQQQFLDAYRTG